MNASSDNPNGDALEKPVGGKERVRLQAAPYTSEQLLLSVSTAFGLGIACSEYLPWPEALTWALIAILAAAITFQHKTSRNRAAGFLLLPFFFAAGSLLPHPVPPPANEGHIYRQFTDHQEVTVSGILTECPLVAPDRTTLRMLVDNYIDRDGSHAAWGNLQLSLQSAPPADLLPGDRFLARTRPAPIRNYGTPGAFNYRDYLGREDIWLTGWIRSPALIMPAKEVVTQPFMTRIRYLPERIRYRINLFLQSHLDQRQAGLYKAILTGDRSSLSSDVAENFKAIGCFHLLAISGLHIGMLSLLSSAVIAWLLKRSVWTLHHLPVWKTAAVLSLIPLTGYALVAGFQTPVVRALIMATMFIIAYAANRQWSVLGNIALAAMLILIMQPAAILTASFQLSFAAVLAIAIAHPYLVLIFRDKNPLPHETRRQHLWHQLRRWLLVSLAVSMAASLGTAPLLALHFNRVSLLSPVSTLLIEPLLCLWALTWGLAASCLIPINVNVAAVFFHIGSWGVSGADIIGGWLASIPYNTLWLPSPNMLEILSFYLLLLTFIKREHIRNWRWIALVTCGLLVASPISRSIYDRWRANVITTFIDVGQGASTLLQLPRGRNVLIDGGGHISPRFNVGEQIIAPFLWHNHITSLEAIVITHPHGDHFNGLPFIVRRFRPRTIWINGDSTDDPIYQEILNAAEESNSEFTIAKSGEILLRDREMQLQLQCLINLNQKEKNGISHLNGRHLSGRNDQSLVLRLDHGDTSFLFPGDVGKEVEGLLIKSKMDIKANVMLAAHHGSRASNSPDFIAAVSPAFMVVSAGHNPARTFANPTFLRNCADKGIATYHTGITGSATFLSDGRRLTTETFYPAATEVVSDIGEILGRPFQERDEF